MEDLAFQEASLAGLDAERRRAIEAEVVDRAIASLSVEDFAD